MVKVVPRRDGDSMQSLDEISRHPRNSQARLLALQVHVQIDPVLSPYEPFDTREFESGFCLEPPAISSRGRPVVHADAGESEPAGQKTCEKRNLAARHGSSSYA